MATITTRAGKGSALTFAEMDANFTNLNDELANVSLGVLPENSISPTELQDTGDFTMNSLVTTAGITVGGSIIPTSNIAVDLGSPTKMFRDVYVGPGSLYVNGVELVSSNAAAMSFTTDAASNQEIFLQPDGDLRLASTQGNVIVQSSNRLEVDEITGPAGGAIGNDINALSFTAGSGASLTATKLSRPSGNFEIETATGGGEYIHLETNDVYLGSLSAAVKVSDNLITTASGALDIQAGGTSNISISPPSANSEGYSTATLDSGSGHFFLKSGLVLDHPGTAGLEAKYSNYITVNTTDGDLNMSSNGGGRIRPRSDFQIRGSDGCDLWLRSEFSTDAKMSYRGGSTEQGALIVDRNNSLVKYYTDSWDQRMESTSGQVVLQADSDEIQLNSSGSNVRATAQDIILQANDDIDFRAADRFQFRSKDSGTSEYNETMTLFQNNSAYTGTAATGALVESSSGKQSGDYDTSLVIRKFDEGDGGSTAHSGISQRIAQYELTLEAGKSTLSLNYRDDDNTGAAQNSTTLIKFKNGTSETATAGTQNAPDQIELLKDVLIQGGATDGRYLVVDNFDGATPVTFGYNSPGITIASKGTGDNRDFPGMLLHNSSSSSGAYPSIWIQRNKNDDPGTTGYLADNERIFAFYGAADRASSYYNQVAGIEYRSSEAHSASAQGGKIEFYTMPNGTNSYGGQTKKMTIDEHVTMDNLLELKAYASGSLPTGVNGALISISDNNYKPAYYNGSTWKYIADDTDV
jgi:hypothetical protein